MHDYARIELGGWKYMMVLFTIIGGIATIISTDPTSALGIYKSYIILPMLVAIMLLTIKPPLHRVLYALSAMIAYIAAIAVFQYVTGYGIPAPWNEPGMEYRITSVYDYPNAVGLMFAPILAMIMAWSLHIGRHRLAFVQLSFLGLLVLFMAKTDGAIIAVSAAFVFSTLFTKYRWLIVGTGVIAMIAAFAWQPTRDILLFQDASGEVRLALWEGTWNLLQDRPLFGAGLASFSELYANYKLDRHVELLLYPHNIFLDFWVELGLAGLIWLLMALIGFFKRLFTAQSPERIVLMAGMVAILVYGLVDVPYFKNDLAVIFWIILTYSSVISWKKKRTA